ncbi:MAG: single-stranded-DNA-specific exonuclease RecJ [Cetobacterium sp.]|uniref:single-stranded-DNA-specific exonuclease RecJ n=1 Tax=Cetobacterium sp. TaxID=2071632 RepID=UPI002FCA08D2
MRNTKWTYKFQENIQSELNFDKNILSILANRGITTSEEIEFFLNGDETNLLNPNSFKDVDKTVDRLLYAKETNQSVWIYGDYDVDGITSVSLCYLALKEIGINVNYYIPLRDEGYGLNVDAITHIKEQGGNLIISVDCGISSHKEIEHCNNLGMDIIVTDHHEINHGIPNAFAVINPKREDNDNDFKYLAGVGTAFMAILALYKKLNITEQAYKYLDIVAIGTVADIVPLVGNNRILVKKGLQLLKSSKWIGLNMLLKRIFEEPLSKKFDTYDIGFIIAPIFNAAGRLEDAKMAVELFVNDSHVVCDNLIYDLINKNSERKEIQESILNSALETIESKRLDSKNVITVADKNFHHGVIGIVASKIVDKFYKPTIIMEIKPSEGIATASCRSIEGFNIIEALNSMSELFIKYGGHAGAAGFSIPIDNIEKFDIAINEYAETVLESSDFIKPIKIDCEIPFYKISYDLLDKISTLEPFGFGNPSPLFSITNCNFSNFRAIGKDKNHLMMNLEKDGIEIKNCVWFNSQDMFEDIATLKEIDVAFKLKMEIYKDRYQYKIFIDDIKPSNHINNKLKNTFCLYETVFPLETIFYTRKVLNDKKLSINFTNNEVTIVSGRENVGYLDSQTQFLLKNLKENFNTNFSVEVIKIIQKEENFNIHIKIHKDINFVSYAIKEGDLFKDIKNFLIGDFNYNYIQKNVLANIFRKKVNTLAIMEKSRGTRTLIETIALYYQSIGKKALLISQKDYFCNYIKISKTFIKGYDFYIFLDCYENEELGTNSALIISKSILKVKGFETIVDSYSIPQNINIVSESELFNKQHIYSKKLPFNDRFEILKNLNTLSEIYGTEDIKVIL